MYNPWNEDILGQFLPCKSLSRITGEMKSIMGRVRPTSDLTDLCCACTLRDAICSIYHNVDIQPIWIPSGATKVSPIRGWSTVVFTFPISHWHAHRHVIQWVTLFPCYAFKVHGPDWTLLQQGTHANSEYVFYYYTVGGYSNLSLLFSFTHLCSPPVAGNPMPTISHTQLAMLTHTYRLK